MPADLKFRPGAVEVFSLLCMVGLGLGDYINYRLRASSQSKSRAPNESRPSGRDRSGDPRGDPVSLFHPLHYMKFGLAPKKFSIFFKHMLY